MKTSYNKIFLSYCSVLITIILSAVMSKRKGLSAEEKKMKMLQLFYEKKEFFQLKDIEKLAPKEKGIIVNSVKEVVQTLVNDGLINSDKIGTSVYFWAFPSAAKNTRKRKLQELRTSFEETTKKLKRTSEKLEESKNGKEDSSERNAVLNRISDLQIEHDELAKKLQKYKDNDPRALEKLKTETTLIRDAANRWTDNLFSIKTWSKNKFNIENDVLEKQFGIPEDLDYIN